MTLGQVGLPSPNIAAPFSPELHTCLPYYNHFSLLGQERDGDSGQRERSKFLQDVYGL